MTQRRTPSVLGKIVTLSAGGYTVRIAEVGATLVSLTGPTGRQLVLPASETEINAAYRGALLAPWPNRLEDGRYTWEGAEHQAPITEVERNNSNHGLLAWQRFSLQTTEAGESHSLTAHLDLVPQPGYPFQLEFTVTYTVSAEGLHCRLSATNIGADAAPYAMGAHPYLVASGEPETPGAVDEWTLRAPVTYQLPVTDRMIPLNGDQELPANRRLDEGLPLAGVNLDDAFGGITCEGDGSAVVRLTTADNTGTGLSFGEDIAWLQCYTDGEARRGVTVEPMSAPANAFNSGTDLTRLEPGETHTATWTIFEITA